MKSKVLQRKMFRDPSEDENVGIMQGFMDSLEEMLSGEGDMSEEDEDSPSGAPERTPRSPEILMNTLRGDMRSVDARVEELADMVGFNAASSTPLEVLALLQPVLKQQGIAALQASSAMPPPAPPSTPVPPVPAEGGGIASLPQGAMEQGAPPMPAQMARGGIVQHFEDGSGMAGVTSTSRSYPPELLEAMRKNIEAQMSEGPTEVPDLIKRAEELAPQYRTLIGADPNTSKGQMLFDVAQAALNYAGNVNSQGQQMGGSQAARLAGAFSGLPGAIGARAADAQKQNQSIRMAAMQGAQSEIDAVRAGNASRQDSQNKIALEMMKDTGAAAAGKNRASPISQAYDNGTVLAVVATPDGATTKVFDPNGDEVLGAARTDVLRKAREEQVDFFQNKASATAEGTAVVARNQNAIDIGFDAAMALPTLKRAVSLLDEVTTGGIDSAMIKAKQFFGTETANEGELASLLGKGVLSQLRTTFGAAFTEKEGSRLEGIEARMGANPATNRRLLGNAMQIMEFAIDRAMNVADEDTAAQLAGLRSLTLGDDEVTPVTSMMKEPEFVEGEIVTNPTTGEKRKLVNGAWVKI